MLQNISKTLRFQKIMVYKTPPWGGGGGEVNHIWLVAYIFSYRKIRNPGRTVTILAGESLVNTCGGGRVLVGGEKLRRSMKVMILVLRRFATTFCLRPWA